MDLIKWTEARIRTFTFIDFAIIKISLIFFTLMIAKLWPPILSLKWYWYGLIFAISYVYILIRLFGRHR